MDTYYYFLHKLSIDVIPYTVVELNDLYYTQVVSL